MNGEATTSELGVLSRLIEWFVDPYKEYNKKEEYAKHQIRYIWYFRSHQIHQV